MLRIRNGNLYVEQLNVTEESKKEHQRLKPHKNQASKKYDKEFIEKMKQIMRIYKNKKHKMTQVNTYN